MKIIRLWHWWFVLAIANYCLSFGYLFCSSNFWVTFHLVFGLVCIIVMEFSINDKGWIIKIGKEAKP